MGTRLSAHQVWALEELARNGPGFGNELFEERGHGAFTLSSFLHRGYTDFEDGKGIFLSAKGRAVLAAVPKDRLGKPNPRKPER